MKPNEVVTILHKARRCRDTLNALNDRMYIKEVYELLNKTIKEISLYERLLDLMDANEYLKSDVISRLIKETEEELNNL